MRILAICAAAIVLAGCTDADWAHVMSYTPVGSTAVDQPVATPQPAATPQHAATVAATASPVSRSTGFSERTQQDCIEWADKRAQDTTNQNFDDATAQRVRDATYADCMSWAVRLHQ